jgi:hypothetical protein
MTNERHEKALEAAVKALILKQNGFQWFQHGNNFREAVGAGIAAYLASMNSVAAPKEPTPEMIEAWEADMAAWIGEYIEDPLHPYRVMLSKAPNHFTNGE